MVANLVNFSKHLIIFPQLEHALAIVSRIEYPPLATDIRQAIIKLRKLLMTRRVKLSFFHRSL
jgi:hypothetical protein